ncbi:hypothetical protein [Lactobacillus helveticus]|nr:hypothetical protein [Lactobacillus helveticus]
MTDNLLPEKTNVILNLTRIFCLDNGIKNDTNDPGPIIITKKYSDVFK